MAGNVGVNAKSIWLALRLSSRSCVQSPGSIVNVSSILEQGGFGKSAAYHASKGVVSAVTRNAAIRYASENIRVNAVSPLSRLQEEKTIEEAGDRCPKEFETDANESLGGPSEIAAAINFRQERCELHDGVELFVDGGWMAA